MEYINLTITQLAEPAYRRSTLEERGLWLTLLSHCVQQENGGRIHGAQGWSEWECLQVLGIQAETLEGEHLLWKYENGDLVVAFYPLSKQKEVQAKRRAGKRGGISSAKSREESAASSASSTAATERKGKEGKGKGKEEEAEQRPSSLQALHDYADEIGMPRIEADKFHDHFEANGWRQGGRTPLRSWRAAMRNWMRRLGDFGAGGVRKNGAGGQGAAAQDNPNAGLQVFEPVAQGGAQ